MVSYSTLTRSILSTPASENFQKECSLDGKIDGHRMNSLFFVIFVNRVRRPQGDNQPMCIRYKNATCKSVFDRDRLIYVNSPAKFSYTERNLQRKYNIVLGDLATVIKQRRMQFKPIKRRLLLDEWPRTIAETMATATKFMRFFQLIVLFSL